MTGVIQTPLCYKMENKRGMNMKSLGMQSLLAVFAYMAAITLWTGCEDSPKGEEVLLNVTPANTSLPPGHIVTFTASLPEELTNSAVYFPLEWKMSSPELGKFLETTGNTAIYQAISHGVNTITVKDQAAREGSAVVSQ